MRKQFFNGRVEIAELYQEFFAIPTFGVTWRNGTYKFWLAFAWLRWGIIIGCCRRFPLEWELE